MTKEELLHQVSEQLAGSGDHTVKQFCSIASLYWAFAHGEFSKTAVVNYIKKLEKAGYSANTRRFHFRVLKRVFEMAGQLDANVHWTFGKRAPSEVAIARVPWEENKPAFSLDEMKAMIDSSRQGKLDGNMVALVALSTTYGLRRCEMADLGPDALNLETRRLRVFTRHGSRLRQHIIPDQLIPYLEHYQPVYSEFKLSRIFHEIVTLSEMPEKYGAGWHSPRRGLVNALVRADLDVPRGQELLYIYDFMRWQLSTNFGMLGTYFTEDPEFVDQKIFERHPFLEFWR